LNTEIAARYGVTRQTVQTWRLERGVAGETVGVVSGGDQQRGGGVRADAVAVEQVWSGVGDGAAHVLLQAAAVPAVRDRPTSWLDRFAPLGGVVFALMAVAGYLTIDEYPDSQTPVPSSPATTPRITPKSAEEGCGSLTR
jgi:hypothetical protein